MVRLNINQFIYLFLKIIKIFIRFVIYIQLLGYSLYLYNLRLLVYFRNLRICAEILFGIKYLLANLLRFGTHLKSVS